MVEKKLGKAEGYTVHETKELLEVLREGVRLLCPHLKVKVRLRSKRSIYPGCGGFEFSIDGLNYADGRACTCVLWHDEREWGGLLEYKGLRKALKVAGLSEECMVARTLRAAETLLAPNSTENEYAEYTYAPGELLFSKSKDGRAKFEGLGYFLLAHAKGDKAHVVHSAISNDRLTIFPPVVCLKAKEMVQCLYILYKVCTTGHFFGERGPILCEWGGGFDMSLLR